MSLKKVRISGGVFSSYAPGSFKRLPHRDLCKETNGSPEFPRQPCECMPWSLTPVVTCILAIAYPGLLPSSFLRPSAFTSNIPEVIIRPRLPISGLNTEPASLIHLASDSRYRAYPQTSLLTCRLGFGQVGLVSIADTHPLVRINQFLSRMGFPRLWIYLGTTGNTFRYRKRQKRLPSNWQY